MNSSINTSTSERTRLMAKSPEKLMEIVLEPVSGKAVPLHAGQTLRISLLDGPQCVDFNCFNLNDYKEHLSQSWTRLFDPNPAPGSVLISRPPRYRPLMTILDMSESCLIDMIGPGCHGAIWELRHGLDSHPNCQDTLAESIREFGLSPDEVHDSYNLWYRTAIVDGAWVPDGGKLEGLPGDYIELLALMDVLAVPAICGSAALNAGTGNFWPKPIGLTVFDSTEHTVQLVADYKGRMEGLKNQRGTDSYRLKQIRTKRKLEADPNYQAEFLSFPLETQPIEVELSDANWDAVERIRKEGWGDTAEEAIRYAVMQWYNDHWANIQPPGRTYVHGDAP